MLFTNRAIGVKIGFLGKSSQKYSRKTNNVLSDEKVLERTNYNLFRRIMRRVCSGVSYSFRDAIFFL